MAITNGEMSIFMDVVDERALWKCVPPALQLSKREREPDQFPPPFLAISIC